MEKAWCKVALEFGKRLEFILGSFQECNYTYI
jgi:hypothetical protein